jgi:hypothetical protein
MFSNSDYGSYSVTVTNTAGSIVNYSFDDQGTLTAPTVSTTELLVNGSPAGLLEINPDSSKSVVIDSFVSTTETVTNGGLAASFYLEASGFTFGAQSNWTGASKFVTGSIVTISSMGQTSVVRLTSDMTYDDKNMRWEASATVISGPSQSSMPTSSVIVTNETGAVTNYDFTDSGFIADSALIGDVSIVGNTIAAVDSYGLASDLNVSASSITIDQDLALNVDSTVSTTETVNSGMNQFYVYGPMSSNVFSYNSMGITWSDASKFVTGSIVEVNDSMDGNVVIQLTSNMTYSMSANSFTATYTVVSGGTDLNMNSYSASTVTVTNTTGSVANYSFDDQGTLTAPTVSTTELLINGSAPALLTSNIDGSKSVVVDTVVQTIETITDPNGGQFRLNYSQQLLDFVTPMPPPGFDTSKFVAGTQITLIDQYGSGTFVVELTEDLYLGAQRYQAQFTMISGGANFNTDMYAYSVVIDNTTGGLADYNFGTDGALTTPTLLATDALIGDVSIVGNTIAGVDSYGLADTLVVDGDLQVKHTAQGSTSYAFGSPPMPGERDGPIYWGDSLLWWQNPTGETLTLIDSLNAGDTVTFEDSMMGGTYYTVTLTSAMTYNTGNMRYEATVAENNSTGMPIGASNNPITVASLITKTSSFTESGLSVDGNLNVTGALQLPSTTDTPVAPTTVVTWAKIVIGGQTYFTPLYQ